MSTFLCFSCYDCERAAGRKARIYVLWHMRIRCFMYQERQTPRRRRNKCGEPSSRRRVPKDDQLSRSRERCGFVDDKANARAYKPTVTVRRVGFVVRPGDTDLGGRAAQHTR